MVKQDTVTVDCTTSEGRGAMSDRRVGSKDRFRQKGRYRE